MSLISRNLKNSILNLNQTFHNKTIIIQLNNYFIISINIETKNKAKTNIKISTNQINLTKKAK